jgi:hypothetical protein
MSEKINIGKELREWTPLGKVLCNCNHEILKKALPEGTDLESVDVEMRVNGVDMPIRETWENIYKQMMGWIRQTAEQLVREEMDNVLREKLGPVYEVCEEMERKARKIAEEYEIELEDDENDEEGCD